MLDSISHADRSFGEIVDEAGGIDAFLDAHAVILMADHAQTDVETALPLAEALGEEWRVLAPNAEQPELGGARRQPDRAGGGRSTCWRRTSAARRTHAGVRGRLRSLDGVDLVAWLSVDNGAEPEAVVESPRGELRFRPGSQVSDRRGAGWDARGRARRARARAGATTAAGRRRYPDGLGAAVVGAHGAERGRPAGLPRSRATSAWTGAARRTSAAPATARCSPATRSARWSSAASSRESRKRASSGRSATSRRWCWTTSASTATSVRAPGLSRGPGGGRPVSRVEETQLPSPPPRAATERARDATARAADWTWQLALRIHLGTRKPANWVQLFKFGVVGATGYVINLIVFAVLTEALDVHHILAAVGAFCVAVTNNFLLNRHWTFRATEGHAGFQAARFFTVSVLALGVNLILLYLLVDVAGAPRFPRRRSRWPPRCRSTSSATSCGPSAQTGAERAPRSAASVAARPGAARPGARRREPPHPGSTPAAKAGSSTADDRAAAGAPGRRRT